MNRFGAIIVAVVWTAAAVLQSVRRRLWLWLGGGMLLAASSAWALSALGTRELSADLHVTGFITSNSSVEVEFTAEGYTVTIYDGTTGQHRRYRR